CKEDISTLLRHNRIIQMPLRPLFTHLYLRTDGAKQLVTRLSVPQRHKEILDNERESGILVVCLQAFLHYKETKNRPMGKMETRSVSK
uniref:Uncharacterized protein n=1 Tax=Oryzias latipes TaxID=8090 RepID=A0A3P9MJA8_ORYLA